MHLRVVVVVALGASLGASVAPAAAASRAAKNRCNDAVMILRSNPGKAYERESIEPLDPANAKRHRAQVVDGVTRARAKLAQIPDGEYDEADAELAECVGELRAWTTYVELLDGKLAVAEADAKVFVPFLATVRPREKAFMHVLTMAADPATRALDNVPAADLRTALDDLATVEGVCAGLPAGYAEPPAGYDGKLPVATLKNRPFAWCRIAKRRTELAAAYLSHKTFAVEGYGAYGIVIPELLGKIEAGKGMMDAWVADIVLDPAAFRAKLAAAAGVWYRTLGVPVPAQPTAGVDAMIDGLIAKVDALAPTLHFETGPRAPAIEAKVAGSLGKLYKGAKPVAYAMDAADFTITKSGAGIPLDRFRSGQVMFRIARTKHCMQRMFSYVETYAGGGRYQRGAVKILGATRFLACK